MASTDKQVFDRKQDAVYSKQIKTLAQEVDNNADADTIVKNINGGGESNKNAINPNKININGIESANGNFIVDENGNMKCKDAEITGGDIVLSGENDVNKLIIKTTNDDTTYMALSNRQLLGYISNKLRVKLQPASALLSLYNSSSNGQAKDSFTYSYAGTFGYNSSGTQTIQIWNTGEIQCVSLTQTSQESQKKNFEKLENALDIIKNIDIYKYNLKTEKDTDKKHIGFVIGDNYKYSKEVTSEDNTGVDLYSFTSLICKAFQEYTEKTDKEIEELKSRILALEKGANV